MLLGVNLVSALRRELEVRDDAYTRHLYAADASLYEIKRARETGDDVAVAGPVPLA